MDDLRRTLVEHGLAGDVATPPASTLRNIDKLLAGDPDYTFGLDDWRDASEREVRDAIAALCGDEALSRPAEGPGWIEPDATLAGIERWREVLHATRDARVLLATGHPTGLLPHYGAIGRWLVARGCTLLTPLDDTDVRYLDAVAAPWRGGELLHSHRSDRMERMLDALDDPPDLVVGDHGMAGAAIARGIATLSIADVNDPALPLAQARGHTDGVLVIDDNLAPRLFAPVTEAMLT